MLAHSGGRGAVFESQVSSLKSQVSSQGNGEKGNGGRGEGGEDRR